MGEPVPGSAVTAARSDARERIVGIPYPCNSLSSSSAAMAGHRVRAAPAQDGRGLTSGTIARRPMRSSPRLEGSALGAVLRARR
jgi:ribosomal protein S5